MPQPWLPEDRSACYRRTAFQAAENRAWQPADGLKGRPASKNSVIQFFLEPVRVTLRTALASLFRADLFAYQMAL